MNTIKYISEANKKLAESVSNSFTPMMTASMAGSGMMILNGNPAFLWVMANVL